MSGYEWDENKRRANRVKHGVDFDDIKAFDWESARVKSVPGAVENGWVAIGFIGGRLHVAVYTIRGERVRIISLRKANAREARHHAQT